MKFSIIVVCLNPGEKLNETLDSILIQSFQDYEIIIKDGGSKDGSVEQRRADERIRFFQQKDTGIYDAMNQAVSYAQGEFVLFLNCGDVFYDNHVLEKAAACIAQQHITQNLVVYGDTFEAQNRVVIASAPRITGLTCYRNIPCHQVCFYSADLCRRKPYDLQYKIRADYDHFLWCYYEAQAKMIHMDLTVASYEGGGFSEKKENRMRDEQEHKLITESYMSAAELWKCRLFMGLTLAPLRRKLASSKWFSGVYHWLKECVYQRKKWFLMAFFIFVLELALLVWPVGWLGEDTINYLTGEGSWMPTVSEEHPGFCQEIIPQYGHLKSMSLLFFSGEQEAAEGRKGNVSLILSDQSGEIVWQQQTDYSSLTVGSYADFDMNLQLQAGETYYLNVLCRNEAETVVFPALCSTDYLMEENIRLYEVDELAGAQLVTRYHYTDTISREKLVRVLILCILTAVGIGFGLPRRKWIRLGVGVALFAATPWILGRRLELLSIDTGFLLPFALKWNMMLMYLIQILVLLVTCSLRWSILLPTFCFTVLYSLNYFVFAFRGVPVRFNDLFALGTAMEVADQYHFVPDSHMAMAWCIAGMILVWAWHCKSVRKCRVSLKLVSYRALCLAAAICIGGISGYQLLYTDYLKEQGFADFHGFDQNMIYHFNGFLVASCIDIQKSRIEKPEGYGPKKVEEILSNAAAVGENEDAALQELPHVILIMNESFADIRILGDLGISEENMRCYYELEENVVRGFTNASVWGGGTANSEFEVFSGCSMGLLPASYYAYQQCLNRPIDTMVSKMKETGYRTISIHPESRKNWNRESIYQYLGFEESYWREDFSEAEVEVIHNGISDLDTYKKLEELFEGKAEGERLFIFDLTMQNHGDYEKSNVTPTVTAQNVNCAQADLFLTLMQKSDSALEQLIRYFEQEDEKVIICLFGDHQPKFDDEEFYQAVRAMNPDVAEQELQMSQYKTPFLIWANYDIEEAEGMDISMNYLGALLMETADVPMSPYFQFLYQQMQQYPVITVNGYRDAGGKLMNWSGDRKEFNEYRMLQYNLLFDQKNTVEWGY